MRSSERKKMLIQLKNKTIFLNTSLTIGHPHVLEGPMKVKTEEGHPYEHRKTAKVERVTQHRTPKP